MLKLAAAALALALSAGVANAAPDATLWREAQDAQPAALALLRQAVDIDSGTGDAAGAQAVQALFAPRLRAMGFVVETAPSEAPGRTGPNLLATLAGSGRGRVLIVAHADTVFPAGTAAQRPFRIDGGRAFGPGVSDEKGGGVVALTALELLRRGGWRDFGRITFLLESGEEIGSPGARQLIARLSREADVEFNMEPGDAPDAITVWRKGSRTFKIVVHGRAAHAGVDPQDGRNAAVELIHQLAPVDALPHAGDGLTANLTTLKAGDRVNVIPDLAAADVNVRVREEKQFADVQRRLEADARTPVVPDTRVEVLSDPAFPPLPTNPATDALAARARAIYAEIGRPLAFAGNGGASESALAHLNGAAALDGLGPVGGGFHSDKEYLELSTFAPRIYLMARLLQEVGHAPPVRR
ncbi:MAG: M20/M25/M40 family metallo-hydrolase [Caulobacteraceae bacterium]|nr:M20/M25/M40 family metallo-hydrolase [Caulobacter sp.]